MEIIFRTRERERVRQELKREHLRPEISSSSARKSKLKISKALESESSNKMTYSSFGRVVSRRSFKPREQSLNQVFKLLLRLSGCPVLYLVSLLNISNPSNLDCWVESFPQCHNYCNCSPR